LVYQLVGKQDDLYFLQAFANRLDAVLAEELLFSDFPVMRAIRREVNILAFSVRSNASSFMEAPMEVGVEVEVDFVSSIERNPTPKTTFERTIAAFELVDRFRLVDQPLNVAQTQRVASVIESFNGAERDLAGWSIFSPSPLSGGNTSISIYTSFTLNRHIWSIATIAELSCNPFLRLLHLWLSCEEP